MTKQLNPYWVSGFIQGEGCFHISFTRRARRPLKLEVRPSFSVSQLSKSRDLLLKLESFFQCGSIRYSKSDGLYKYESRSLVDLREKILPHFEKYELEFSKAEDFKKFKEICSLLVNNREKTKEGMETILLLAFSMTSSRRNSYSLESLLKFITS